MESKKFEDLLQEVKARLNANNSKLKKWKVWSEGYAATGERGGAILMGEVEAPTFDDAIILVIDKEKNRKEAIRLLSKSPVKKKHAGNFSYWACRFYSDEKSARKTFG